MTLPKILLVDDELMLINAILPGLQRKFDVSYVQSLQAMRERIAVEKFDVVVLDLVFDTSLSGVDLIPEINKTGAKILVVSARCNGMMGLACLRNGIRGFLDKQHPNGELEAAIECVLSGHYWFSESWMATVGNDDIPPLPRMDNTGHKILHLLCQHPIPTNSQIAAKLHLSVSRINNCLTDLMSAFEVNSRHELVDEARWRGFLPDMTHTAIRPARRQVLV